MSTLAAVVSESVVGIPKTRAIAIARRALLITAGALLVAGAAQIRIPLPFTPVPITGQTFGVLLVGAALGAGDGLASMLVYVLLGSIGLPFFAGGASGWSVVTGATGGYLAGFVVAAAVAGFFAQRGWDRRFSTAVAVMLTGNVVIYLFGVVWLANVMNASPLSQEVLVAGLYPFVIGDIIKTYLAAALLPGAWRLVGKGAGQR